MTKLAVCLGCLDMVAPRRDWRRDRAWRCCECGATATRWRDGDTGDLEITSRLGRGSVRALGLNNAFLLAATRRPPLTADGWQALHEQQGVEVSTHYLFHAARRGCWALVVRPGETGDVHWVDPQAAADMAGLPEGWWPVSAQVTGPAGEAL